MAEPIERYGWARTPVGIAVLGVMGAIFFFGALVIGASPINVFAYKAGYGPIVEVHVTKGSTGHMYGPRRSQNTPGEGWVTGDHRTVYLYDVQAGEIVSAHTQLINLGSREYVYRTGSREVNWDILGVLGALVMGTSSLACLGGAAAGVRKLRRASRPEPPR